MSDFLLLFLFYCLGYIKSVDSSIGTIYCWVQRYLRSGALALWKGVASGWAGTPSRLLSLGRLRGLHYQAMHYRFHYRRWIAFDYERDIVLLYSELRLCVLNDAPFENRWRRFTANHRTGFTDEMRMHIASSSPSSLSFFFILTSFSVPAAEK